MTHGRSVSPRCQDGLILAIEHNHFGKDKPQVYLRNRSDDRGQPTLKIGISRADKDTAAFRLESLMKNILLVWEGQDHSIKIRPGTSEEFYGSEYHQLFLEHLMIQRIDPEGDNFKVSAYPAVMQLGVPRHRGIVYLGAPCAGKTTVIREQLLGLPSSSTPIPHSWDRRPQLYDGGKRPWMYNREGLPYSPLSRRVFPTVQIGEVSAVYLDPPCSRDQVFILSRLLQDGPIITDLNSKYLTFEDWAYLADHLTVVLPPELSAEEFGRRWDRRSNKSWEKKQRYVRESLAIQAEYGKVRAVFPRVLQLTSTAPEEQFKELQQIAWQEGINFEKR